MGKEHGSKLIGELKPLVDFARFLQNRSKTKTFLRLWKLVVRWIPSFSGRPPASHRNDQSHQLTVFELPGCKTCWGISTNKCYISTSECFIRIVVLDFLAAPRPSFPHAACVSNQGNIWTSDQYALLKSLSRLYRWINHQLRRWLLTAK